MKQRFFITATGTGIGKTFITAALARQAAAQGRTVMAYKPVISGFDPADAASSDTGLLAQSLGLDLTNSTFDQLSPWRYTAALGPSIAARMENRPLDFDKVVAHSRRIINGNEDLVLIEGVGGVMVPMTDQTTVLEWIAAIEIPVILVCGTYLGTLSHTLTALAVLAQKAIPVAALIINQSDGEDVGIDLTRSELARHTKTPLFCLQYGHVNCASFDNLAEFLVGETN